MKRGYNYVVRVVGSAALAAAFVIGSQAFTPAVAAACSNGQGTSGCKSAETTAAPESSFDAFLGGLDLLIDTIHLILP